MSKLSWNSTKSADWTTAADWSGGVVPGAGDDVTIAVANVTVTVSTGQQNANSITTTSSILSVTGGALTIATAANLHGAYSQSAGFMTVNGQGLDFFGNATVSGGNLTDQATSFASGGTFTQSGGFTALVTQTSNFTGPISLTGGTLQQQGGAFTDTGNIVANGGTLLLQSQSAAFSNTITLQSGVIDVQSGSFVENAGVTATGGILELGGQTATIAGAIALSTGGEVQLQSGSLTAAGTVTVSGGTLAVGGQIATINAPLTLSSGLITVQGAELLSNGTYNQTGGTLALSGFLDLAGAVTISGGLINQTAGAFLSSNSFSQSGGTLQLTSTATFSGSTTLTGGTININNGQLISTGGYTQNSGTLTLTGPYSAFNGATTLAGGTINSQAGTLVSSNGFGQSGGLLILAGTGGVFNNNLTQTGGTIRLQSGTLSLFGASNTLNGTITGAGTLLEAGAVNNLNGTTTIGSNTVLSTAKVAVTSGVLALAQSGPSYNYSYGGYLTVSNAGTFSLNGNTLTLTGRAELAGDLTSGTIVANGNGQLNGLILDNSAVLDIASAYTLTALNDNPGVATLRADSQILITNAGSLTLTGNDFINDVSSNATLTDNGLLQSIGGAATAEILPSFIENHQGDIVIGLGTIDFSGSNNLFEGTASGNGTLSIGAANNGLQTTDTFGNNTAQGVGNSLALTTAGFEMTGRNTQLNFTFYNQQSNSAYTVSQDPNNSAGPHYLYTGAWVQSGGVFLLGNQGQTLTLDLTGNVVLDGGVIKSSAGTIATTGLVTLSNNQQYPTGIAIEGFTNFSVAGTLSQTAQIQLGAASSSKPVATILRGAIWNIEDSASITGAYGEVVVSAGGTLSKANGSLTSSIDGTLVNNGMLNVAAGTLLLDGSGTLGGNITGNGLLALQGNGTYTLASSLSLNVGQILIDNTPNAPQASVVALAADQTFGGVFTQHGGTLQLDGETLTLKGATALDGGVIAGPGTLTSSGALTLGGSPNSQLTINGQANLTIAGSAEQITQISVDGLANLTIAKGGSYTQDDTANIIGAGTLTVSAGGTMHLNGTGFETISPTTVNAGSIQIEHGEISFLNALSGNGNIIVRAGAELDLMGSVSSTNKITMSQGNASLLIGDAPAFNGIVTGFVSGDFIEISALQSGTITESFDKTGKILTLSDSASHTFSIHFNKAFTLAQQSQIIVSDGPHGYIGVYHI